MSPKRAANFPDVPTVEEATRPQVAQGRVARLWPARRALPKEIATQYETAIKKIWDSSGVSGVHDQARLRPVWMDSAKFAEFMKTDNEDIGKTLKSLGLAK